MCLDTQYDRYIHKEHISDAICIALYTGTSQGVPADDTIANLVKEKEIGGGVELRSAPSVLNYVDMYVCVSIHTRWLRA